MKEIVCLVIQVFDDGSSTTSEFESFERLQQSLRPDVATFAPTPAPAPAPAPASTLDPPSRSVTRGVAGYLARALLSIDCAREKSTNYEFKRGWRYGIREAAILLGIQPDLDTEIELRRQKTLEPPLCKLCNLRHF